MSVSNFDQQLLKRCVEEQPGAWKDFVDRFLGLFAHVVQHTAQARSVKLRPEDVDDLCAEILLALLADDYAVLRHFRGNSSLATYLTVIARRICVKEVARRRKAEALGHVNARRTSLPKNRGPRAEQKRIEDREQVQLMLRELPERDAEVVRQFHLEGKSYSEISARLGIAENSIGPTLSRARKALRRKKVET